MIKNIYERIPVVTMDRIEEVLDKKEFEDFKKSLNEEPVLGLRINTLKISVEDFLKISPFKLEPIPWAENGFYYSKEERPGKHPYYYAGLYYLQEPSAMLPAETLKPDKKSVVLDLCAAPGGKSTQLAEMMENQGILFVNDISPKRTMALISNIIRMGVTNTVVCNSKPETISKELADFFTHILIDAPCSGEGMFRRDPSSIEDLSLYSIEECQGVQKDIIESAFKMLKNGGLMTFSTCTFNKLENEENITWLCENFSAQMIDSKRIWPHKEKGEGQFAALIKKESEEKKKKTGLLNKKTYSNNYFTDFIKDTITEEYRDYFDLSRIIEIKERLYLLPDVYPNLKKINVLRPGLLLGELKKNRFEPSPDLALALPLKAFKKKLNFSNLDQEVLSYLKGETIIMDFPEKGWSIFAVDGFPLGWFKKDGNFLKNYYPKNMRRMD